MREARLSGSRFIAIALLITVGAWFGGCRREPPPSMPPGIDPDYLGDLTYFRLGSDRDLKQLESGVWLKRHRGRGTTLHPQASTEYESWRNDPRVQWAVFDLDSGQPDLALAHSPNADEPMYLASIAKIFTAAAVLERIRFDRSPATDRHWNDLITLFTYRSHRPGHGSNASWLSLLAFLNDSDVVTSANVSHGTSAVAQYLRRQGYTTIDVTRRSQRASALELGRFLADVYRGRNGRGDPLLGADALFKLMGGAGMPRAAQFIPPYVRIGGKGGLYPGGCGTSPSGGGTVANLLFFDIGGHHYSMVVNGRFTLGEFPCAGPRVSAVRAVIGGLFWEYIAPREGLQR